MSQSLYRALLRLYPASFRAEYGEELLQAFAESSRRRGRVAAMGAAVSDVVPNALLAHGTILGQDLRYAVEVGVEDGIVCGRHHVAGGEPWLACAAAAHRRQQRR